MGPCFLVVMQPAEKLLASFDTASKRDSNEIESCSEFTAASVAIVVLMIIDLQGRVICTTVIKLNAQPVHFLLTTPRLSFLE